MLDFIVFNKKTTGIVYKKGFKKTVTTGIVYKKGFKNSNYRDCI
jgi:hypothetical protein